MGILDRFSQLFGRPEQKMNARDLMVMYDSGSGASAKIDWKRAIEVSTVLACVRVIANGVAQVPFRPYQEIDGSRSPAKDHPLYDVLSRQPNAWQTSFEFRETIMFHVLLTGNAYVFVNRVGSARKIIELRALEPNLVEVKRAKDGSLTYKVRSSDGGETVEFAAEAIWHLRGPSWNGWMGLEATKLARAAIGLSIDLEESQSSFQRNSASASGMFSVSEPLSPEQYEFLAKWLDKYQPGGERHNKPLILDRGTSFARFAMSGVDQQMIETRKHQIEEICREFGVMPIMVGHADKTATYASAEQMFLAHVVHTLSPWYQRLEQSADVNLLTEADRLSGIYSKFTPNALMRGAANDRANFYKAALGAGGTKGWMTQNEVRSFEEMDRSDDPEADKLPQPTAKSAQPDPAATGA